MKTKIYYHVANMLKTKFFILGTLFLTVITISSCTVQETAPVQVDNDTISTVLEVTTSFNSGNLYSQLITFSRPIYSSDMVLIYHLYDVVNGADVWRQMPQNYYFSAGDELTYNFDFTKFDATIFLEANFDLNTLSSSWTQNQTFRIVIIPGAFGNKMAVDYSNYSEVAKTFKIKESEIVKQ